MPENRSGCRESHIKKAFEKYRDAWHAGKHIEPETYCKSYPEIGTDLQERIENFRFVVDGLPYADHEPPEPTKKEDDGSLVSRNMGDFRILKEINRGGMGIVYEAEQVSLKRRVALKLLGAHLSFSDQAVRKFRREAEAGGRQQHPGIVAIHAVGEHKGVHYIAQEFVEGGYTLGDRLKSLRETGDPPIGYFRKAAKFIARVADALYHAHRSGVIHRDVKPSNILMSPDGQPKITDFGLARVEDALSLSRTGDFAGTPYYMSPEQAASRRIGIDHRTDIYSLGVTLYEMITLTKPFEGENPQVVLKKILLHDPENPCKVNSRVPRDLSVICLKAMEKRPEHRYPSMEAFADDLRRFANGETILARQAGAMARLGKRMKRNPAKSALVGLGLLTWIVVIPYLLVHTLIAKEEKNRLLIRSEGNRLISNAFRALEEDSQLALRLGIDGSSRIREIDESPDPMVNNLLLKALYAMREERSLPTPSVRMSFPIPNTSLLVIVDSDRAVKILETATGESERLPRRHKDNVGFAAVSTDGSRLLTASGPGDVMLWHLSDREKSVRLSGHIGTICHAGFNRPGDLCVTVASDLSGRIWNTQTGESIVRLIGFHAAPNRTVFSIDSEYLAVACKNGSVQIRESMTGDLITSLAHESDVIDIRFMPNDSNELFVATRSTGVIKWNIYTGNSETVNVNLPREMSLASFDHSCRQLVIAGEKQEAVIYSLSAAFEPIPLRGHDARILHVNFNAHDTKVITASEDGTTRIWTVKPGPGFLYSGKDDEWPDKVCLSRDLKKLARVSFDCLRIRIRDLTTGEMELYGPFDERIKRLAFSSDRAWLAIQFSQNSFVRMQSMSERNLYFDFEQHQGDINCIAFNSQGNLFATASSDNKASILSLSANKWESIDTIEKEACFTALDFHPNETIIAVCTEQGELILRNFETRETIWAKHHRGGALANLFFSPDGTRIVTASRDKRLKVWDWKGNEEIKPTTLQSDLCMPSAFLPDGNNLVATSGSGTAIVWSLDSGKIRNRLNHDNPLISIRIAGKSESGSDGVRVIIATNKRTRLWRLQEDEAKEIISLEYNHPVRGSLIGPAGEGTTVFQDSSILIWPTDPHPVAVSSNPRDATLNEKDRYALEFTEEEKSARDWVNELINRHYLNSNRIQEVSSSELYDEEIQGIALKLLTQFDDLPCDLTRNAWNKILSEDAGMNSYSMAYHLAEEACSVNPENSFFHTIKGAALYRLGEYTRALAALDYAALRSDEGDEKTMPANFVFLAMTYHQMGRELEANSTFSKLREILTKVEWAENKEIGVLVAEAESVMDRSLYTNELLDSKPGPLDLDDIPGILYVENMNLEEKKSYSLKYIDSPGSTPETVRSDPKLIASLVEISPCGDRLAIIEHDYSGGTSFLSVIPLHRLSKGIRLGTADPVFTPTDHLIQNHVCWNPDGDRLYFCMSPKRAEKLTLGIYYIDLNESPRSPHLVLNDPEASFSFFSIDSTGNQVCFGRRYELSSGYSNEIWSGALTDDGNSIFDIEQVTFDENDDSYCMFTPDGLNIIWLTRKQMGCNKSDFISHLFSCDLNVYQRKTLAKSKYKHGYIGPLGISKSGLILLKSHEPIPDKLLIIDIEGRLVHSFTPINGFSGASFLEN